MQDRKEPKSRSHYSVRTLPRFGNRKGMDAKRKNIQERALRVDRGEEGKEKRETPQA